MTKKQSTEVTVGERFLLLGLLPQQGAYQDMKLMRKFKEALSFSEEEHSALKFRKLWECCGAGVVEISQPKCPECDKPMEDSGRITWEQTGDVLKEIICGNRMLTLVKEALEELSTKKQVQDVHLSLFDKFVGGEVEE